MCQFHFNQRIIEAVMESALGLFANTPLPRTPGHSPQPPLSYSYVLQRGGFLLVLHAINPVQCSIEFSVNTSIYATGGLKLTIVLPTSEVI